LHGLHNTEDFTGFLEAGGAVIGFVEELTHSETAVPTDNDYPVVFQ
jgi:hypothetical protein